MRILTSDDKKYRTFAFFAMALLLWIVFSTFRSYGVSWDEEIQSQYGQAVFDYYASGFVDRRYDDLFNLYIYGGMFDGLAAFVNAYTPISIYETRHLLNALFGLLGLWGIWRLGRLLGGARVGLFSLLLLATTPMFYGHIYNNPKDIPFATGIIWTLYYMAKSLREFPHVRWTVIRQIAIIFGLTLGIRVGGIMLFGYWGAAMLLQMLILCFSPSSHFVALSHKEKARTMILGGARLFIPAFIAAYCVMLLCWPWAQENPIKNPLEALAQFSNFPQEVEVLLDGVLYMSTNLPWDYVPRYFWVQLPALHVALAVLALVLIKPIYRSLRLKAARSAMAMILLMGILPTCYAIFRRPALYDAVRHFIFVLPLLAMIAALALDVAIDLIKTRMGGKALRAATLLGTFFLTYGFAEPVWSMIQLHPYEYIYVNQINGGVDKAYGRYELDYWGSSFKEAAERLQKYVADEGGVPAGTIYKIGICGPWSSAMIYLPPDYEPVEPDDPKADFFLSTTRWMCQDIRQGPEIVRVERLGVPLSIIKDLRKPEEKNEKAKGGESTIFREDLPDDDETDNN